MTYEYHSINFSVLKWFYFWPTFEGCISCMTVFARMKLKPAVQICYTVIKINVFPRLKTNTAVTSCLHQNLLNVTFLIIDHMFLSKTRLCVPTLFNLGPWHKVYSWIPMAWMNENLHWCPCVPYSVPCNNIEVVKTLAEASCVEKLNQKIPYAWRWWGKNWTPYLGKKKLSFVLRML